MIVWRIRGNEIGPNGNGASHFATKREADDARREFNETRDKYQSKAELPERIVVRSREELARALDDAMGYGAS
jgi:hypothetical protein